MLELKELYQEAIDLGLPPEDAMDHAINEYAHQSDMLLDRYQEQELFENV